MFFSLLKFTICRLGFTLQIIFNSSGVKIINNFEIIIYISEIVHVWHMNAHALSLVRVKNVNLNGYVFNNQHSPTSPLNKTHLDCVSCLLSLSPTILVTAPQSTWFYLLCFFFYQTDFALLIICLKHLSSTSAVLITHPSSAISFLSMSVHQFPNCNNPMERY